jgi:hypothetical protein
VFSIFSSLALILTLSAGNQYCNGAHGDCFWVPVITTIQGGESIERKLVWQNATIKSIDTISRTDLHNEIYSLYATHTYGLIARAVGPIQWLDTTLTQTNWATYNIRIPFVIDSVIKGVPGCDTINVMARVGDCSQLRHLQFDTTRYLLFVNNLDSIKMDSTGFAFICDNLGGYKMAHDTIVPFDAMVNRYIGLKITINEGLTPVSVKYKRSFVYRQNGPIASEKLFDLQGREVTNAPNQHPNKIRSKVFVKQHN